MKAILTYLLLLFQKPQHVFVECSVMTESDVIAALRWRQYVDKGDYWENGFVRVYVNQTCITIRHAYPKNNKGVKAIYEKQSFHASLHYMEGINNKSI